MAYAWDLPAQESNKEWIIREMHEDTGIPIDNLRILSFEDFERIRKYKEDSWKKNRDATKDLPRLQQFPINNDLYRSFKEDCVSFAARIASIQLTESN